MAKSQNIESVLKFLDDTVSIEDFLDAVKKVMEYIDSKHLQNKEELAQIAVTIAEKWAETNDRIKEKEDELEDLQKRVLLDLSDKQKAFVELVRAKVDSIKVPEDGKDAEEVDTEELAMSVYDMLLEKIPQIEEIEKDIPKLGQEIRNALELLVGDERLKIDAIKDLREELDDIKKSVKGGNLGGGAGASLALASWPIHEAFTMDGILTSVTLTGGGVGAGGNACIVRYQGQTLDMTSQYTVNGNTITLVGFVPESGTTISITYWR